MHFKANPSIANLAPYVLADLSVPAGKRLISLAQNELCYAPTEQVINAAAQTLKNPQLYPDPNWSELTQAIASVHALNRQQILCGAGSMELLEALGRAYLSANDQIIMSEYGYSFFKTIAQMHGAQITTAKEPHYTVCVDLLVEQIRPNTKIVFIANPGNPTGTIISAAEIRRLRGLLDKHILLIVDEAYAEFADPKKYPPLFDLVDAGNTVVLRTFSKIYGLAGMRVGWGYFPPPVHATLRKVLNPNSVTMASQAAATMAMTQQDVIRQRREQTHKSRAKFCQQLNRLGLSSPVSCSNFMLIDFGDQSTAQACFTHLRAQGILMRPVSGYGLNHCLRATLSTPENMQRVIDSLAAMPVLSR